MSTCTWPRASAGRYLVVFFIRKPRGSALSISAREMTGAERRYFHEQEKQVDPIPDEFTNSEEATESWDKHDTTHYPNKFRAVKVAASSETGTMRSRSTGTPRPRARRKVRSLHV